MLFSEMKNAGRAGLWDHDGPSSDMLKVVFCGTLCFGSRVLGFQFQLFHPW